MKLSTHKVPLAKKYIGSSHKCMQKFDAYKFKCLFNTNGYFRLLVKTNMDYFKFTA